MCLLSESELSHLLSAYGYWSVGCIVALESMGIPLPGEVTLIAAALIAASGHDLNIWYVIAAATAGAILGDNAGFGIGRVFGYRLLVRYGRYVGLTEARIQLGRYLFLRHGAKVVVLGRFVSLLRALAALLAGANCMSWPRFLFANAFGGAAWALTYGLAVYWLGRAAAHLAKPVGLAIGLVAAIALLAGIKYLRGNETRLEAEATRQLRQ